MPANTICMIQAPQPEGLVGNGFHCPGCGLPFNTIRDPRRPADRVVGTGIEIDFVGSLVVCEQCIKDMAQAIGWIDPEAGKARTSDVRRHQRREEAIKAASDARDSAAQAAAALSEALSNLDEILGD